MRMWGVNPEVLCQRHLLGEHVEMHMFVGTINKGVSVRGYVKDKLVNTSLIKERHDQLAEEMRKRGMNHRSPLEYSDTLNVGEVDIEANLLELQRRCPECKRRQDANTMDLEVSESGS